MFLNIYKHHTLIQELHESHLILAATQVTQKEKEVRESFGKLTQHSMKTAPGPARLRPSPPQCLLLYVGLEPSSNSSGSSVGEREEKRSKVLLMTSLLPGS